MKEKACAPQLRQHARQRLVAVGAHRVGQRSRRVLAHAGDHVAQVRKPEGVHLVQNLLCGTGAQAALGTPPGCLKPRPAHLIWRSLQRHCSAGWPKMPSPSTCACPNAAHHSPSPQAAHLPALLWKCAHGAAAGGAGGVADRPGGVLEAGQQRVQQAGEVRRHRGVVHLRSSHSGVGARGRELLRCGARGGGEHTTTTAHNRQVGPPLQLLLERQDSSPAPTSPAQGKAKGRALPITPRLPHPHLGHELRHAGAGRLPHRVVVGVGLLHIEGYHLGAAWATVTAAGCGHVRNTLRAGAAARGPLAASMPPRRRLTCCACFATCSRPCVPITRRHVSCGTRAQRVVPAAAVMPHATTTSRPHSTALRLPHATLRIPPPPYTLQQQQLPDSPFTPASVSSYTPPACP